MKGKSKKSDKKKATPKKKRAKKQDYDDASEEDSASSMEYSEEEEEEQKKKAKKKKKKEKKASEDDGESDVCDVCSDGGFLIVCEKCDRNYHLNCLDEPLKDVPEGIWICPTCVCFVFLIFLFSSLSFSFLVSFLPSIMVNFSSSFRLRNKKAQ